MANRTLHADVVTASAAAVVRATYLVDIVVDSGAVYFWGGTWPLVYGGNTYTGTGTLGNVSGIEESVEARPSGVVFSLSGIASGLIALVLGEHLQGRTARVYIAAFDSAWAIIGTPVLVYEGNLDVPSIELSGATLEISLTSENRFIDLERPGEVRTYSDQDQQQRFPGDLGLSFVAVLQKQDIYWARKQPGARPPPPVAGGGSSALSESDPPPSAAPEPSEDIPDDSGGYEPPFDPGAGGDPGASPNYGYGDE